MATVVAVVLSVASPTRAQTRSQEAIVSGPYVYSAPMVHCSDEAAARFVAVCAEECIAIGPRCTSRFDHGSAYDSIVRAIAVMLASHGMVPCVAAAIDAANASRIVARHIVVDATSICIDTTDVAIQLVSAHRVWSLAYVDIVATTVLLVVLVIVTSATGGVISALRYTRRRGHELK